MMGRWKTDAELAWDREYGNKTEKELEEITRGMIGKKLDEARARAEQRQAERDARYNLSYSEIIKALSKAGKQIKELENKPEALRNAKREELEKEYSDLVMRGMQDTNKELWICEKLGKYVASEEYRAVKAELEQARTDYAIFSAKKEAWEQDNLDIIEAERIRTRRAELLQASPEALRALGINPDVIEAPHFRGRGTTVTKELEERALEAMTIDTDALFAIQQIRNASVSQEE